MRRFWLSRAVWGIYSRTGGGGGGSGVLAVGVRCKPRKTNRGTGAVFCMCCAHHSYVDVRCVESKLVDFKIFGVWFAF